MADKAWKKEERTAAAILSGERLPANSGGRVDVESDTYLAQVKNVARLSLAQLEGLALEMATLGEEQGKVGMVVVKRKAGRGTPTPRLIVLTGDAWRRLQERRGHVGQVARDDT